MDTTKVHFADYRKIGCKVWDSNPGLFKNIYDAVDGNICEECGHGKQSCPGGEALLMNIKHNGPYIDPRTNAEIATDTGLSKRQISKMRKAGKL